MLPPREQHLDGLVCHGLLKDVVSNRFADEPLVSVVGVPEVGVPDEHGDVGLDWLRNLFVSRLRLLFDDFWHFGVFDDNLNFEERRTKRLEDFLSKTNLLF